jgi:hypothetical protein
MTKQKQFLDFFCRNQATRSKELYVELQDRIVTRHRSGEGYKTISAALKVPKNTVASIILNGKSLESPRLFLELAARPNGAIGGEGSWSRR